MIHYNLESHPDIIEAHYKGLESRLRSRIKSQIKKSALNEVLLTFINDNLEKIITSKPNKLVELNEDFKEKGYKNSTEEITEIKKIFNYKEFTEKPTKYDAYNLAQKLGVRVCLYCNRSYTITVFEEDKITRPQFDHFFDKANHPLLALSIYNLIPCCNICNSTLKGRTQFTLRKHLHPYVDNVLKYYTYTFIPHDVDSLMGEGINIGVKIKINKDAESKYKIVNSSKVFKLEDIMSAHAAELKDLLLLRYKYSERYFQVLCETYEKIPNFDVSELYRLAFGVHAEEEQFSERPFSKLKKDILNELHMIEELKPTIPIE